MDPSLSDEALKLPPIVGILFILVIGSGLILWLTPHRFTKADLQADRLPGWSIRWIDFSLWLLGLYGLIYGFQVLVFVTLPQILPFTPPWDLETGDRNWTVLVGGLSLQLPLLGYFFLLRAYHPDLFRFPLSADTDPRERSLLRCLVLFLLAMPLVLLVNLVWNLLLNSLKNLGIPIDDKPQEVVTLISDLESVIPLLGFFVLAVILAPLAEELIFRAAIYGFLKKRLSRWAALLISSFAFALLHANLASFLPLLFLGVVLTLVYEASGHIRVPILLHALFNAHQLLVLILISTSSNGP